MKKLIDILIDNKLIYVMQDFIVPVVSMTALSLFAVAVDIYVRLTTSKPDMSRVSEKTYQELIETLNNKISGLEDSVKYLNSERDELVEKLRESEELVVKYKNKLHRLTSVLNEEIIVDDIPTELTSVD